MINKLVKKYQATSTKLTPTIVKTSVLGTLLSLAGVADVIYLTVAHYNTKVVLACPDTGFINCARVTTSSYSEIFSIPVALLGLLFFIAMLVLQLPWAWRSQIKLVRVGRLLFAISGMLFVFWLLYVEFHLLHNICLFCTAAHILSFGIFVTTLIGTSLTSVEEETVTKKSK